SGEDSEGTWAYRILDPAGLDRRNFSLSSVSSLLHGYHDLAVRFRSAPGVSNDHAEPGSFCAGLWRGHAGRRQGVAPARIERLVVYHCLHADLLASHVHRRLDGLVAVGFRALQVEQSRTRIVGA